MQKLGYNLFEQISFSAIGAVSMIISPRIAKNTLIFKCRKLQGIRKRRWNSFSNKKEIPVQKEDGRK